MIMASSCPPLDVPGCAGLCGVLLWYDGARPGRPRVLSIQEAALHDVGITNQCTALNCLQLRNGLLAVRLLRHYIVICSSLDRLL
jgi:hypothetical protein